jgi:hypothetical protein
VMMKGGRVVGGRTRGAREKIFAYPVFDMFLMFYGFININI